MNNGKHKLEDLFSDSGPFDEAEVVKAIQPFITIQKSTNEIFFKKSSLTVEEKILVFALTKKLLQVKGYLESDLITAAEVHKKTGIKKGSVDPTFKRLKDQGFLVGKREYEIPVHKIPEVISLIDQKA
ncbi:MAG: hypothetical protein IH995_01990 [Proteobacteria bacterium]|nr:hypothetical protein [Pseudomonadota bacterium]